MQTAGDGSSYEVTAVYVGGWWVLPLGIVVAAAVLVGVLWWLRRRARRR